MGGGERARETLTCDVEDSAGHEFVAVRNSGLRVDVVSQQRLKHNKGWRSQCSNCRKHCEGRVQAPLMQVDLLLILLLLHHLGCIGKCLLLTVFPQLKVLGKGLKVTPLTNVGPSENRRRVNTPSVIHGVGE